MELRRLLSGGRAGDAAALSVLLVGHRTLLDTLRAGGVEPDVLCHLRPLTREQTVEYIAHRLRAAGHRRQLFTPTALRKIWVVSEGIPRVVNGLCIDALTGLRLTKRRKVSASLIDRAAREPDELADGAAAVVSVAVPSIAEPPVSVSPRRRLLSLAGGAAIAATLFAALIFTGSDQAPWVSPRPAATTASTMPDHATNGDASAVIHDTDAGGLLGAVSMDVTPPAGPVSGIASAAAPASPAVSPSPAVTAPPKMSATALPRERRATASAPRRPDDVDDPGATIDWLLKERRISR
jgi:general secretion pathway protein A